MGHLIWDRGMRLGRLDKVEGNKSVVFMRRNGQALYSVHVGYRVLDWLPAIMNRTIVA